MFAKSIVTKGGDVFRDEKSLAFDGTDDYIAIPETTYDVDGGTVSFTFWAKRNDISVQNLVMSANNNYKNINLHSNGNLYIESDTNDDLASATITNDTNWHHYVITCNSGTVAMYEDGTALSMGDSSISDDITFNKISTSSSKVFNGNISEIAIYNCTLTANQVKTIYNGREPYNHKEGVASGNLTSWYRMGDGLEKNKGLHSLEIGELITVSKDKNMDSSNNWDVSSANWSIDGNSLDYDGSGGGSSALDQTYPSFTQGRTYEMKFNTSANGTILAIKDGDGSNTFVGEATYSSGTKTVTFIAPATTDGLMFTAGASSAAFAIDWVNVKEFNVYDMSDNTNDGRLINMTTIDFEGDTP